VEKEQACEGGGGAKSGKDLSTSAFRKRGGSFDAFELEGEDVKYVPLEELKVKAGDAPVTSIAKTRLKTWRRRISLKGKKRRDRNMDWRTGKTRWDGELKRFWEGRSGR